MHIRVDTSGRLDEFGEISAIGVSDGWQSAICLPGSLKREATELLRKQGKGRAFCKMRLFVIALYLLLRPFIPKIDLITIDRDFKGWEGQIISMLVTYLRRHQPNFTADNVRFDNLRRHQCHVVANSAFRGKFPCVEPDREEFLGLVAVRQKNNRVSF